MEEERLRSMDSILQWTRAERESQLRHFDSLDTKAGLILGFSGALAGLARTEGLVVEIGRYTAVLSSLVALLAFWPRGVDVLDLRVLRDLYVGSEPEFTKLRVLDTQIAIAENVAVVMQRKARFVKVAMGALVVAALLIAVGLGLEQTDGRRTHTSRRRIRGGRAKRNPSVRSRSATDHQARAGSARG